MTAQTLHPKGWKPAKGYANGMSARGRMVLTGGLIGWNADGEGVTDDFVGQVEQVLKTSWPCWPRPVPAPGIWCG